MVSSQIFLTSDPSRCFTKEHRVYDDDKFIGCRQPSKEEIDEIINLPPLAKTPPVSKPVGSSGAPAKPYEPVKSERPTWGGYLPGQAGDNDGCVDGDEDENPFEIMERHKAGEQGKLGKRKCRTHYEKPAAKTPQVKTPDEPTESPPPQDPPPEKPPLPPKLPPPPPKKDPPLRTDGGPDIGGNLKTFFHVVGKGINLLLTPPGPIHAVLCGHYQLPNKLPFYFGIQRADSTINTDGGDACLGIGIVPENSRIHFSVGVQTSIHNRVYFPKSSAPVRTDGTTENYYDQLDKEREGVRYRAFGLGPYFQLNLNLWRNRTEGRETKAVSFLNPSIFLRLSYDRDLVYTSRVDGKSIEEIAAGTDLLKSGKAGYIETRLGVSLSFIIPHFDMSFGARIPVPYDSNNPYLADPFFGLWFGGRWTFGGKIED